MSERSECCGAILTTDSTGDKICTICGTIQDNYPSDKKEDSGK